LVSVDTRTAFERRQPSVDLRAFLDPLKPGDYFDCGQARLYGIEALEAEALRRGRAVGDDEFQLVATDGGLIFCRASIMFAIAARWKDLTIGRPEDGTQSGEAILPIEWPTHGDLQFTVSRRLGSNVFRRWLQLQAQATRRSQVEQDARFELSRSSGQPAANGHRQPVGADTDSLAQNGTVDLRNVNGAHDVDDDRNQHGVVDEVDLDGGAEPPNEMGAAASAGSTLTLEDSDREAIDYIVGPEPHGLRCENGEIRIGPLDDGRGPTVDPLATLDASVVDEWVDDRVPHTASPSSYRDRPSDEDDAPTLDPFGGRHGGNGHGNGRARGLRVKEASSGLRRRFTAGADSDGGEAVRFEADPTGRRLGSTSLHEDEDPNTTRFMSRTADGTDIFPGDGPGSGDGFGPSSGTRVLGSGPLGSTAPVPEISGARLQAAESREPSSGPKLDIRSAVLAGRQDSPWIEMLRERQVLVLTLATIFALGLIALIGFWSDGGGSEDVSTTGAAESDTGAVPFDDGAAGIPTSTIVDSPAAKGPDAPSIGDGRSAGAANDGRVDSTVSTLRVSSTAVQICHSNYGGCVPVAADVDCEGDGDGPAFQTTPVAVFGDDVYDLDTDDDREACEPGQPRLESAAANG